MNKKQEQLEQLKPFADKYNELRDITTISIDRKVFKTLLDIKYTMGFKSMTDVIKFLLSGKKQK